MINELSATFFESRSIGARGSPCRRPQSAGLVGAADGPDIGVQLRRDGGSNQVLPVLRREDHVNQQPRQRLGHGAIVRRFTRRRRRGQPLQGWVFLGDASFRGWRPLSRTYPRLLQREPFRLEGAGRGSRGLEQPGRGSRGSTNRARALGHRMVGRFHGARTTAESSSALKWRADRCRRSDDSRIIVGASGR